LVWTVSFSLGAKKSLKSLDRQSAERVVRFLNERVATLEEPREVGKALQGRLRQYWAYRVGDYRIICDIQDSVLTILVVEVGNRKDVYKSN
jgi:mRNA interferase RelE/StbE